MFDDCASCFTCRDQLLRHQQKLYMNTIWKFLSIYKMAISEQIELLQLLQLLRRRRRHRRRRCFVDVLLGDYIIRKY